MKEEKLIELIHKRATNELTEAEHQQLNQYLEKDENQLMAQQIETVWKQSLNYQNDYQPNVKAGWNKFKAAMVEEGSNREAKVVPMKRSRSLLQIAAVAAVLLIAGWFGSGLFNSSSDWQEVALRQEVALSDGSTVAVNDNSSFQYPTEFSDDQRLVKLSGEAFFDVAKNPQKPFIIESGVLQVKVLGTSFNIRNFEGEFYAYVTVRSGKVEVTSNNGAFTKILEKGDRLIFDKRKGKLRAVVKDENFNDLAWWSGKIAFETEKIARIKEVIEHTYNVQLEFTNADVLKCDYTISNDVKAEGLDNLLEGLKIGLYLEGIEKTDQNNYRLIGGKCNF